MKLTMSSEMGIHAVWFLAELNAESPVLSSYIAESIQVSESYLIKVLKRLVASKVLNSRKGKKGGYLLRRPPEEISLKDVILACEGDDGFYECLHEERECGRETNCPIRQTLARGRTAMYAELDKTTFADLVQSRWPRTISEMPVRG